MTTTTIHRPGTDAPSADHLRCVADVEAWVDATLAVLRSIPAGGAGASPGLRRWLRGQVAVAAGAIALVEDELGDAEHHERPCHELEWLHTRISIVVDAVTATEVRRAA